jgi:pimeloyl-ACP methyl ester carboxylesterase
MITRHFVRVGERIVHYRKAGSGPPVLFVHQSPRSSAEYVPLMERWSAHFTCIAPDSPGFGQSTPLPGVPEVEDFADATVAFMDAIGLKRTAAYGFHSGGFILVTAARRHPERFAALAAGGYGVWTEAEKALFAARYLPPFLPLPYGEHLTWLWGRIIEQSWFFPWFDARPEARMRMANDDPALIDPIIREMLDSGDAYRAGYGAVMRANRDVPGEGEPCPPVLIAAYDGDPMQSHIDRLGALPRGWRTEKVRTPADLEAVALAHVRGVAQDACSPLAELADEGFVPVTAAGFSGLIHWKGNRGGSRFVIHAPGRSCEAMADADALMIDLPGHGLSDGWDGAPSAEAWAEVAAAALTALGGAPSIVVGEGASLLLAATVAAKAGVASVGGYDVHLPLPADSARWAAADLPDLTPDRHAAYLHRAWNMVRARHFFWPWFEASAAHAIPFDPADVAAERLAREHREAIRARSGPALLQTLLVLDRDAVLAAAPVAWLRMDGWARDRSDVWKPPVTVEWRD